MVDEAAIDQNGHGDLGIFITLFIVALVFAFFNMPANMSAGLLIRVIAASAMSGLVVGIVIRVYSSRSKRRTECLGRAIL